MSDLSPAKWLASRMHADPLDVGAVVPTGYVAYLRIFHPAMRNDLATGQAVRLSWADVARGAGRAAHPLMQWERIRPEPSDLDEPSIGTLTPDLALTLAAVLASHSSGPYWFGVWSGRQPLLVPAAAPTFRLPLRDQYLLRGPIDGLVQNLAPAPVSTLPGLAWPDDRSWVLATDADLRSSYLAASVGCAAAVLSHPGIEASPVDPADPITLDSDPP